MATYEPGKVGDDIALQYELLDSESPPSAQAIDSATISIRDRDTGVLVVDAVAADLPVANIAQYVWTPVAPGTYHIEWHVVHSGGSDLSSATISIVIRARVAS